MAADDNEPTSDVGRLSVLRSTSLLDSPAEESFDRLARLATRFVGVPIAVISLLDEHRVFFKSGVGLPEPWASRREAPISETLCRHVVSSAEAFVVEDVREHPLTRNSRAVSDLGIIAYAGIPLLSQEGHVLGVFGVADVESRAWTDDEIGTLQDLASVTIAEIDSCIEVRTAQVRLRSTLEAPLLPIVVVDLEGRVQDWNEAAERVLGWSRAEALGKLCSCVPEERRSEFKIRLSQVARGGTVARIEERRTRKDGSLVDLSISAVPIHDGAERVSGVVIVLADITEYNRTNARVHRSERRFQALIEQSSDAVAVVAPDDTANYISPAACHILGYPPRNWSGISSSMVFILMIVNS